MNDQPVAEIISQIKSAKEAIETRGECVNTIRVNEKFLNHPRWEEIKKSIELLGLKLK
jgi:hypothetical protein